MFFRIIIFLIGLTPMIAMSESPEDQLHTADSLFKNQKYTEALKKYEVVYESGYASSAMLLKMAFINEGLNKDAQALYFLEQYYRSTSNKKALEKSSDIARENNLSGYEYADEKFFLRKLHSYKAEIMFGLIGLSALLLILMFIKKASGYRAVPWIATQVVILSFAAILMNDFFEEKEAIINTNTTILMDGPSGASKPITGIQKGDKVKVLNKADLWTLIQTEEAEGFVRSNQLKPL